MVSFLREDERDAAPYIYSIIYSIECMVSFLREDERDAASYGFPSVKHGLFTHKQLLLK